MFSKKKYQFENILDAFKKYQRDYCITIEQENGDIKLKIESKVKPSKPPKRAPTSLKSGKTNEIEKVD